MNPSLTFATAGRVLTQLRRDHRTLGMIIVIPCLLITLIRYVFGDDTFERIGLPLVGIFPFIIMFLVTSIAMLRERSSGTLERLMTLPSSKLDLLLGYGLAFAAVARSSRSRLLGRVRLPRPRRDRRLPPLRSPSR